MAEGWSPRWQKLEKLGRGGQGVVHKVRDSEKAPRDNELVERARNSFRQLTSSPTYPQQDLEAYKTFEGIIQDILRRDDPTLYGALKILHDPESEYARDPERAQERFAREIAAMQSADHPHLLRILDASAGESLEDEKWYVSEYHPRGSLYKTPDSFVGDAEGSLSAFRGLVEGVASLHDKKIVHRDIKPQNIFFATDGRLVLGDFGLVFVQDGELARLSGSQDNAGSRDWMPPWEYAPGTDNITPAFDVFSLCKVLWAMIAGAKRVMPLWYYDDPRFNLEKQFPDNHHMKLVNSLLGKCVVEKECDCLLPYANALLSEVDMILNMIELNASLLDEHTPRPCRVCGRGEYTLKAGHAPKGDLDTFSLQEVGRHTFNVFTCDYCGHIQQFFVPDRDKVLPAWKKE